jgi:5-methylcytosine-specific restriction endonuclease McrA
MPYKDPAKRKEYLAKYRLEEREQIKEKKKEYREKNKDKIKQQKKEYYEKQKEQLSEKQKYYYDERKQNAYHSIITASMNDSWKWDLWCEKIKRDAEHKHSYSDDFTNDIMFEKMVQGCFYCGDIATTIDRLYSDLDHTQDNCVGCCGPCNNSKGAVDPPSFIRKSYYKARGKYYDDVTNMWFVNKNKPRRDVYKRRAVKQGVAFELTKKKFEDLIVGDCEYCHRSPTTWFGIDRVIPKNGYIDDNVVSCCWDCNLDKHKHDVETAMARNERIASRVDNGYFVINCLPHVILHHGTQNPIEE